jgi:hypothetical protein
LLPFDKKDHIWEWNGSKFIKSNEWKNYLYI